MRQVRFLAALAAAVLAGSAARATISLELRTAAASYLVGEEILVDLYALSDDPDAGEAFAAMEVILSWPASRMQLVGIAGGGEVTLIFEGFPAAGSGGLNEADPPADGDAMYLALAGLGTPALATPAGTRVTTFRFLAVAPTAPADPAVVDIEETGGDPERRTVVFSGVVPNKDVTGGLSGASVTIIAPCGPADLNADGVLDFFDVQIFLQAFSDQNPLADLAPPTGVFDFFDVQAYLQLFSEGCP